MQVENGNTTNNQQEIILPSMDTSNKFDVKGPQLFLICLSVIQFQLNLRKSSTISLPTELSKTCCKYNL